MSKAYYNVIYPAGLLVILEWKHVLKAWGKWEIVELACCLCRNGQPVVSGLQSFLACPFLHHPTMCVGVLFPSPSSPSATQFPLSLAISKVRLPNNMSSLQIESQERLESQLGKKDERDLGF